MKKTVIGILCAVLILAVVFVSVNYFVKKGSVDDAPVAEEIITDKVSGEEKTEEPEEEKTGNIISAAEAEQLCRKVMGEVAEETGFPMSYGYTETVEINGRAYHAIRVSWLVNNSHMSYIGDLFVTTDGSEIYDGVVYNGEYEIAELRWEK